MEMVQLKQLVAKARSELVWTVQDDAQESAQLRIFSDPVNRTHTIYHPSPSLTKGAVHYLLYLHELGHALLCERVHPFFASGFPIAGLADEQIPAVGPVLSAASDWFVGHWLLTFCPETAHAELEDEYQATAEMIASGVTPDLNRFFVAVLITAQSIKYLQAAVECTGFLDAAVQAFLAVPPEKPTLELLLELFNRLLALGAPYRCRQVTSQGQDVLEFYRSADGSVTAAP